MSLNVQQRKLPDERFAYASLSTAMVGPSLSHPSGWLRRSIPRLAPLEENPCSFGKRDHGSGCATSGFRAVGMEIKITFHMGADCSFSVASARDAVGRMSSLSVCVILCLGFAKSRHNLGSILWLILLVLPAMTTLSALRDTTGSKLGQATIR